MGFRVYGIGFRVEEIKGLGYIYIHIYIYIYIYGFQGLGFWVWDLVQSCAKEAPDESNAFGRKPKGFEYFEMGPY